jgi:hypothetical protein
MIYWQCEQSYGKYQVILRPKEDSLQAYKDFINSMYQHLNGSETKDDDMSEAEWEADWQLYLTKKNVL